MPRLQLLPPATVATTQRQCVQIIDFLMKRGGTLAIDSETTGLDIMRDRVLFWSMATENNRYCFPVSVLPYFEPLFQRRDLTWCMANAKYDMHLFSNHGVRFESPVHDIIVMDAMVDDTRPHGLKEQAWLGYEAHWGEFKELFLDASIVSQTLGLDRKGFQEFKKMSGGDKLLYVYKQQPQMVVDYASCDAFFTLRRWMDLRNELAAEDLATEWFQDFNTLYDYFEVMEVPMTQVLWHMERRGVTIDQDYVKKLDEPMRRGIRGLEEKLHEISGKKFNPDSPEQVSKILYDDAGFGLKKIKYTKGGKSEPKPSTDEKTLKILMERSVGKPAAAFIQTLLDRRKLTKAHGTYVVNLHELLGPDGKIHTKYNQAGARTARFSSSDPNVQNIPQADPKKDPYLLRGAFTASPGNKLVDRDYPQIEFRVAAVHAGETKMLESIRKGWDIHNSNTFLMFGIAYEEVAEAQRKKGAKEKLTNRDLEVLARRHEAKTVGLGTMFGEGVAKMALGIGCDYDRALELRTNFFDTFEKITQLIKRMHEYGHDHGFTYTMLGRKRRLHGINSGVGHLEAKEERQAFNTNIQGSAAELMKLAMLRLHFDPRLEQLGAKLILTVHDELILEAPDEAIHDVEPIMTELMADPMHWGPIQHDYEVPITPDGGSGYRWSEIH